MKRCTVPEPEDTPEDTEERLAAWILAHGVSGPLGERHRAVEETGSCRNALRELGGRTSAESRRAAERSFHRARELGYRVVALTERAYPPLLARITDPPLALSLRGSLTDEDALGLAVVGSRRATPYGLRMGQRLARELAAAGLTIVSGLARGIDAAAHRGALESGGRTIAVLGSGLERLYPREHGRLAAAVAERGAVVSEFDLDEPPHARNFPRRNRVITGLALGCLVVEAADKSGSLVSARHAMEQDREVFAVPGPATSPTSEGAHALLRDGARLVTTASDVLEELRPEVRAALEARRPPSSPGGPTKTTEDELDPEASRILEHLGASAGALDVDAIVEATRLDVGRVLAGLTRLEVAGHVVPLPGGVYRCRI